MTDTHSGLSKVGGGEGKLSVPGCPTNLDKVGQGPIVLAVGHFSLIYLFSFLSPSLGDGPI